MSVRKIERTRTFADNLKNLSKKYAGLSGAVDAALNQYAATGESATSFRLIRVKGLPVFKDRLAFGNRGKRGAARIVYYCDPERVLALFLFAKSKREDVPTREILDALKSAGLLESGESPPRPGSPRGE